MKKRGRTTRSMADRPAEDDWRRQGQENYLKGRTLTFESYAPSHPGGDHDHCEFCGNKFSAAGDDLHQGYATADKYHWVCSECFCDFESEMDWKCQE